MNTIKNVVSMTGYCMCGFIAMFLALCVFYTLNGQPQQVLVLGMDVIRSINNVLQLAVSVLRYVASFSS